MSVVRQYSAECILGCVQLYYRLIEDTMAVTIVVGTMGLVDFFLIFFCSEKKIMCERTVGTHTELSCQMQEEVMSVRPRGFFQRFNQIETHVI